MMRPWRITVVGQDGEKVCDSTCNAFSNKNLDRGDVIMYPVETENDVREIKVLYDLSKDKFNEKNPSATFGT